MEAGSSERKGPRYCISHQPHIRRTCGLGACEGGFIARRSLIIAIKFQTQQHLLCSWWPFYSLVNELRLGCRLSGRTVTTISTSCKRGAVAPDVVKLLY